MNRVSAKKRRRATRYMSGALLSWMQTTGRTGTSNVKRGRIGCSKDRNGTTEFVTIAVGFVDVDRACEERTQSRLSFNRCQTKLAAAPTPAALLCHLDFNIPMTSIVNLVLTNWFCSSFTGENDVKCRHVTIHQTCHPRFDALCHPSSACCMVTLRL